MVIQRLLRIGLRSLDGGARRRETRDQDNRSEQRAGSDAAHGPSVTRHRPSGHLSGPETIAAGRARHGTRIRVSSDGTCWYIRRRAMGSITGSELLAKSLKAQGMDTLFYLMGGPMLETESACIKLGVRAIDSRHEQGA